MQRVIALAFANVALIVVMGSPIDVKAHESLLDDGDQQERTSDPAGTGSSRAKVNPNAAVFYWQAIECTIDRAPNSPTYPAMAEIMENGTDVPIDANSLTVINWHGFGMGMYFLHRGSRLTKCDWGITIDELGPAAEQGVYGHLQRLSKAACLRARYYFREGRATEATNDLIAVLRLANHIRNDGRDGTHFGMLTSGSMERRAFEIAARNVFQLKKEDAMRLQALSEPLPVREIFENYVAVQPRIWVDWPRKFAEHARRHDGDWDAYWRGIGLQGSETGTQYGSILREAANDKPERLLEMSKEADGIFRRGLRLARIPEEQFIEEWGALLNSVENNLIVEIAGGELEPIYNSIRNADAFRELFRCGVSVAIHGRNALEESHSDSTEHVEYRNLPNGFELISSRKTHGERLKLVFETD